MRDCLAVETLETGGTAARQLMDELLGLETRERLEIVRGERFRSLVLAELLIAESERCEEASPARARELAELAGMIADRPHPGSLAWADRIVARSYALQGNARRLSGDRQGAEECFRKAASALTGPPSAIERGFYCQRLAYLREDQGDAGEAAALLWRAVLIFREARHAAAQAACLCRLAFLALKRGDPAGASRLLTQAIKRL